MEAKFRIELALYPNPCRYTLWRKEQDKWEAISSNDNYYELKNQMLLFTSFEPKYFDKYGKDIN